MLQRWQTGCRREFNNVAPAGSPRSANRMRERYRPGPITSPTRVASFAHLLGYEETHEARLMVDPREVTSSAQGHQTVFRLHRH